MAVIVVEHRAVVWVYFAATAIVNLILVRLRTLQLVSWCDWLCVWLSGMRAQR